MGKEKGNKEDTSNKKGTTSKKIPILGKLSNFFKNKNSRPNVSCAPLSLPPAPLLAAIQTDDLTKSPEVVEAFNKYAASTIDLPKLDPYSGETDCRMWNAYVKLLELQAKVRKHSDEDIASHFYFDVVGDARSFYESLDENTKSFWRIDKNNTDAKGIYRAFCDRYEDPLEIRDKLINPVMQKKGEHLSDYCNRVKMTFSAAFPEGLVPRGVERNRFETQYFLKGLSNTEIWDYVHEQFMDSEEMNIDKAVEMAFKKHDRLKSHRNNFPLENSIFSLANISEAKNPDSKFLLMDDDVYGKIMLTLADFLLIFPNGKFEQNFHVIHVNNLFKRNHKRTVRVRTIRCKIRSYIRERVLKKQEIRLRQNDGDYFLYTLLDKKEYDFSH